MTAPAQRWELLYNQTPLSDVARHFQGIRQSPFLLQYLSRVLELCPRGGRTCETGIGSGYGAIWLSLRGILAEGIDYAPGIVERARQVNNIFGGQARFREGDLFAFYPPDAPRYHVVHHQGVLEHFTVPQIRAALAQQVALAEWVVFSVPSVYYPFDPEFGDERLLPIEEWERILASFAIEELRYYGDPNLGAKEQILCVLRGQPVDDALLALMTVPEEPYPEGISVIVQTRNEERNIGPCLETVVPFASEILVCDMESTDRTVEIARQFTDIIVRHPHIQNFDRARNVSAMRAKYRWVFYLDADERVPPGLGPALQRLIATQGETFEAALVPFRHYFCGRWMQCLYPGYTAPRLLKNGKFIFTPRLHSGAQVEGRIILFPADNPDLALVHHSFDSMAHYLEKLNRYTDGEAANMHRDGHPYHWQHAIRHFVHDFQDYYEKGQATKDGVHGFIYSFLSAFYRFEQHAKLYEQRFREGKLQPQEQAIPANLREMLLFALSVADEKPLPQAPAIRVEATNAEAAQAVWSGPLWDPSGYGEESRHLLFAADQAGVPIAAQPLPWSNEVVELQPEEHQKLTALCQRPVAPGFVQIVHNFAPGFARHPEAGIAIGRTLFETDRLPTNWVTGCNRMDHVWVATEFNRQTFAQSGVEAKKLVVVPECLDPAPFLQPIAPSALAQQLRGESRFVFLSIFDWTLHKGWDVLLKAFLTAFEGRTDVKLILKVWSTMGYTPESLREQANVWVRQTLGHDLAADPRIRFLFDRLPHPELLALYCGVDAYALPSRGEGWGRPYMEAMACGLPTLATDRSGNTAFMNPENSYLCRYTLQDVPEIGWRLPAERRPFGHGKVGDWDCVGPTWMFEIAVDTLARQMRKAFQNRDEVKRKGAAAVERVRNGWTWKHSTEAILQRLGPSSPALLPAPLVPRWGEGSVSTGSESIPLNVASGISSPPRKDTATRSNAQERAAIQTPLLPSEERTPAASAPVLAPRRTRDEGGRGLRVSLCMIVRNEERVLPDCLGSIKPFVDEMIIVDTGSTDRTVEIAEQFGAKVFHFPWTDSFSEARNVSLEHATGDWIFWMDADDTIPEECGRGLRELARLAEDRVTGFLIHVHIPPAPGDSGFTVVDHVKLFRNWPELRFEGRIHEQILEPIYRHGGTLERSNLYVVHSGYDYSPEGQQRKRARDLTLLEKDLADRPDHPFVLFNIGMTAYHLKEHDKAIPALDRCLEVSKPYESTVRKVYAMLTGCHMEQGNLARAKERLEQGFVLFPTDPELLFRGGILYRELGNLPAAEMCYLNLLNAPETGHIDSLDITMTTYKAHHNLALIYQDMGRLPEALAQWEAAIASNPTFAPSLMGLAELYLHLRRFDDVRAILARLQTLAPDQTQPLHQRLAQACL